MPNRLGLVRTADHHAPISACPSSPIPSMTVISPSPPGRICMHRKKVNISTVLAGQRLGIKEVDERIWLVTFMHYDLGYFDDTECRMEPLENPFGPKVLPMSPE